MVLVSIDDRFGLNVFLTEKKREVYDYKQMNFFYLPHSEIVASPLQSRQSQFAWNRFSTLICIESHTYIWVKCNNQILIKNADHNNNMWRQLWKWVDGWNVQLRKVLKRSKHSQNSIEIKSNHKLIQGFKWLHYLIQNDSIQAQPSSF